MDVHTAVAASMLPAWRPAVAAAFRDLRQQDAAGMPASSFLEVLWSVCGKHEPLPPSRLSSILTAAAAALDAAERLGIVAIPSFDERYPPLLACIADPPPVLWARGQLDALDKPAVAVVGSRAATPYALEVGTRIAAELAGRGIVVVSGLARGVDSAAHRATLGAGPTIAVQGCGLDRVYPPEHADLASQIIERGLLLSELAPGAPPLPDHFPLRNRIISGLSLGTVVVEASEHSGSLITARYASEQGRDVMAVPGSVLTGRNRGSHALLKDGARFVETADDILQELGWPALFGLPPTSPNSLNSEPLIEQMLPGECYGLDALVALTGVPGPRLLARLTELEIAGIVSVSSGQYMRRT